MRLISILAFCAATLISSASLAQVKDYNGNYFRPGRPTKPIKDYDGGTISRGRAAKCVVDSDAPMPCIFYPRNGNGSFAIDVNGLAYYAGKTSLNSIEVNYDNGARMVSQGSYRRSSNDAACWIQGSQRKLCVY